MTTDFCSRCGGSRNCRWRDWQALLSRATNAEEDLAARLRGSELVKWQFRGVAQTGLMVPRNLPGRETKAEATELERGSFVSRARTT